MRIIYAPSRMKSQQVFAHLLALIAKQSCLEAYESFQAKQQGRQVLLSTSFTEAGIGLPAAVASHPMDATGDN